MEVQRARRAVTEAAGSDGCRALVLAELGEADAARALAADAREALGDTAEAALYIAGVEAWCAGEVARPALAAARRRARRERHDLDVRAVLLIVDHRPPLSVASVRR